MSGWPKNIIDEDETLDAAIAGVSLARFGDGELNLAVGGKCVTQVHGEQIGAALRAILANRTPGVLVCIPRLDGPKLPFWRHYQRPQITRLFSEVGRYGSAFVTRPDSAPNIDRPDYWSRLRRLWAGKRATLVRGSGKSLTAEMLYDAAAVTEILVPKRNAFEAYEWIRQQISARSEIVLLCCGPTATILADDLGGRGLHAVDLGHVGMFLRKHLAGEPMIVTAADKRVDREMAG